MFAEGSMIHRESNVFLYGSCVCLRVGCFVFPHRVLFIFALASGAYCRFVTEIWCVT